jgi:DNA repair exonuclease SbcCD ATPase subunit
MAMLKEQYQLGKISIHEYTMATDNLRALYSSALSDLSANVSNVITQTKNLITSTKELEDAGIETGISVDDLTKRLERWSQIEIDLSEDIEQIINFRTAMGVMAEYEKQAALAGNDMIAVFNLTQDALDKLREQELDLKLENNFKGAQIVSEMIQDLEYRVETLLPLIDELKQKLQEKSEIQGLKDNIEALARTKEAMDKFGSSGSAYRDLLSDLSGALDTLIFKAKMFQLGSPEELATWELMLEKIQAMEAEQQSEMFEEDVKQRENIISYYEQENIGLERRKSLYQGIISDYEKEIEAKVSSLDYDKETVEELKKQKEEYGILLELIEEMIKKQNELSNDEQAQEKLETLEAQLKANRDEQDAVKELNLDAEMQNQLLREELSILEEIVILVQMAGLDLNIDEQLAKIKDLRGRLKDTAADAKTWQDSIREQERLLAFYNQSPESEEKVNKIKSIYESMKNIIENQIEDLVKAGDANSAMIPVLQEKLALYDAELASINQQEDAHEAALEKQKNALQMQADQYNTLMGAVANGFSQFGETGQLISNILGEMKFKVEELEDGTSRLVSPFEDMEGLIANIGTQLAVFGIEQVMTLAANLLYTFQEVKRIQGDLNKWEYDTRDLNKMLQDFRNFEQNKQALSDKMFELPFAKFLDAITFGLFGFSQGVEDEISELKEKLDITFNDLAGALGM